MSGLTELVQVMAEIARGMRAHRCEPPVEQTLRAIIAAAVEAVPGADDAGISYPVGARIATRTPRRSPASPPCTPPSPLASAEREEHLATALRRRDRISQAKGILMERFKLTPGEAFALLARASSVTNRKVKDIAEEIATTGELPG